MVEVWYNMLQLEAPRLQFSSFANSTRRVATDRMNTSTGTRQGLPGKLTIKNPVVDRSFPAVSHNEAQCVTFEFLLTTYIYRRKSLIVRYALTVLGNVKAQRR